MQHKNCQNVQFYILGAGSVTDVPELLGNQRGIGSGQVIFIADHFFINGGLEKKLGTQPGDEWLFVDTTNEPHADYNG